MLDASSLFLTKEGSPLQVGDQTITVVSRALRWTWPMGFGGIVWNRPVAVKVRATNGVEHVLPVVDETRRRQIMVFILGLVGAILISMLFRPRRS